MLRATHQSAGAREQRMAGTLGVWAEPFTQLRLSAATVMTETMEEAKQAWIAASLKKS